MRDDDPDAVLTLTRTATAGPGGTLRWKASIDRPTNDVITLQDAAVPVTSGRSLRPRDLTEEGRGMWGVFEAGVRDRSLATAGASTSIELGGGTQGTRSTTIEMPLVRSIGGLPRTVALRVTGRGRSPVDLTGSAR